MRKRKLKIFLIATFIAIILLIGMFIILYSFTPVIDNTILKLVNVLVGDNVDVHYDRIEGNLLGTIRLSNVNVNFNNTSILCKKVTLKYSSTNLVNGLIDVDYIIFDSPEIKILESKDKKDSSEKLKIKLGNDSVYAAINLKKFPPLTARQIYIKNGILQYIQGDKTHEIADISLETSANISDNEVLINVKYLKAYWKNKNLPLNQLSFTLKGNKNRVTLNQLHLDLPESNVYAHGEIELLPRLRFLVFIDTSIVDFNVMNKLNHGFPFNEGYIKFYGDYIGDFKNFVGQIFLSSEMDSLELRQASLEYQYKKNTLTLKNMKFNSNFGKLYGHSSIALKGDNRIKLNFNHIDLKKINFTDFNTEINGELNLNFDSWDIAKINGSGQTKLYNIVSGKTQFDSLFLDLKVQEGNWTLLEKSRLVVQSESQFFLKGTMSREKILALDLGTDNNNLDTLGHRIGIKNLGGMGSMNVSVSGPLSNPDIEGYVLLDSLVYSNQKAYGVEGSFNVKESIQGRDGYLKLQLSSGLISSFEITDGVIDLRILHNTVYMDSISFYNFDNYVSMDGHIKRENGILDINIYNFDFKYQDYSIMSTDTLIAYYKSDSLMIENFLLTATGEGEIEVRGMLDLSGDNAVAIYFKNIQLLPFNQFVSWQHSFKGLMEISLEFLGSFRQPQIETELNIRDFKIDNDFVGDLVTNLTYKDNFLNVEKLYFEQDSTSFFSFSGNLIFPTVKDTLGRYVLSEKEEVKAITQFKNIKIENFPFFKRLNFPVTGKFDGKIDLTGNLKSPIGSYSLEGENVQYRDYIIPKFNFNGELSQNEINVKPSHLNFLHTDITIRGKKTIKWDINALNQVFENKEFSLFIKIKEDSLNFLNVVSPELDIILGNIDINLELGGDIDKPLIKSGNLNIRNGNIYLAKVENPITNVKFSAVFENNILNIKKFEGNLFGVEEKKNLFSAITSFFMIPVRKVMYPTKDEGKLELSGKIDFATLNRPKLNLKLDADHVYLNYFLENAKIVFSADNFFITGKDTILLKGNIIVHKGEIDLDIEESEKNLLLSSSVRKTPPYLEYMLNITIPGNFYIRSEATFNAFDMMLLGDLKVIQEPKGLLEMSGNLDVPKGHYFQFEDFNITNGRVEFINPKELPELNLQAEKKKHGYLFKLNVTGKMNNPIKEIRILDLETQEDITYLYPETKDQITLLLFGVTFDEIGSSAGNVALAKGQDVVNQVIISRIEREARRFIGLDEIRVENPEGFIDFTNLRLNQPSEESAISLGKYLMPNLYLEYKTQLRSPGVTGTGEAPTPRLGWEAGNRIYLEYRINRNWSVSSFYVKQIYDKFKIDISWRYSF